MCCFADRLLASEQIVSQRIHGDETSAEMMPRAINKDDGLGFVPLLLVSCPNFVANKNGGKPCFLWLTEDKSGETKSLPVSINLDSLFRSREVESWFVSF